MTVTRLRSWRGFSCCLVRLREGVVARLLRCVLRERAFVLDVLRERVCRLGADCVLVWRRLLDLLRDALDELDRDLVCLLDDWRRCVVFGERALRLGLAFSCFSTRLFVPERPLLRWAIASGVRNNTVQSNSNRGTHRRAFKWEQLLIISSGLDLLPARAI